MSGGPQTPCKLCLCSGRSYWHCKSGAIAATAVTHEYGPLTYTRKGKQVRPCPTVYRLVETVLVACSVGILDVSQSDLPSSYLQFVFDLPKRLRKCLEHKAYAQAVKYYVGALPILNVSSPHLYAFSSASMPLSLSFTSLGGRLRS